MIYLKLLLSFLQIGLFSVGGGYAAIALIKDQVVDINGWLTAAEFSDLTAIAEMTPGPIAVNAATFVGIRIAGFPGALIATAGCILPSCIISSIIAFIYYRYKGANTLKSVLGSIRPVTIGIILSAGISLLQQAIFTNGDIGINSLDIINLVLFSASFITLRKIKCSPILVILLSGIICLAVTLLIDMFQ